MGRLDWGGGSSGRDDEPVSSSGAYETYESVDPASTVQVGSALPPIDRVGVTPVPPPKELLIAAGAVVALSGVLLLGSQELVHFAGYLLGTMVTIVLVAAFYREDLQRKQSSAYAPQAGLNRIAMILVGLGFAFAVIHVWRLARALT